MRRVQCYHNKPVFKNSLAIFWSASAEWSAFLIKKPSTPAGVVVLFVILKLLATPSKKSVAAAEETALY
jgi:hypothetical protein